MRAFSRSNSCFVKTPELRNLPRRSKASRRDAFEDAADGRAATGGESLLDNLEKKLPIADLDPSEEDGAAVTPAADKRATDLLASGSVGDSSAALL